MERDAQRIHSIDMLKGICMFFMLIDHWRIRLSQVSEAFLGAPNNPLPLQAELLQHADTASFWLLYLGSHFVAPSFLFLAGAGGYLWRLRHPQASFSTYLISRGCILALINCLLFSYAPFSENGSITLHVLWPAGIGMVLLGCVYKLPKVLLILLVLVLASGQDFFESISFSSSFINTFWRLAFIDTSIDLPWGAQIHNIWPIMHWFSMLLLGYLCGSIFVMPRPHYSIWFKFSIISLGLFLLLRLSGLYGDPNIWQLHDTLLKTMGHLIAVTKHAPSLQYILYGLGITFLLLTILERFELSNKVVILLGSAPLLFYISHTMLLRIAKFILLRVPTNIMDHVSAYLFSFTGLMLSTFLFIPILYYITYQYKIWKKEYPLLRKIPL